LPVIRKLFVRESLAHALNCPKRVASLKEIRNENCGDPWWIGQLPAPLRTIRMTF
jgi:hypothetical protein